MAEPRHTSTMGQLPPARPDQVQVLVLGPVGLHVGRDRIEAPSAMQRAVLAALTMTIGRPVTHGVLHDVVWGQRMPRPGPAVVPMAVHRLRGWLQQRTGDVISIASVSGGYALSAGERGTDLGMFRALVAESATRAGLPRLSALERALALWRGRPLADVPPNSRDEAMVGLLEREKTEAVRAYATTALELGMADRAVRLLEEASTADALDESIHALLMEALAANGRHASALHVYERMRVRLSAELGVDPGPRLQAAHLQVLRQETPIGELQPVSPSMATIPCLLPPDIADFTGRERELIDVHRLLSAAGQVGIPATLTIASISGRAGVGKTALAVRASHLLRDNFADGQMFVNLRGFEADPASPVEILGRMLRAFGVNDTLIPAGLNERQEMYRSQLAGRRVLVVLDNVAEESQIEPLLPGVSTCAVLTTSRRKLTGLAGVHSIDLDVLDRGSAVLLLRSIAGPPRIVAEPAEANDLADLCGRLPLALRVVGAKLAARRHWTLRQMADRLADERRRLDELTYRHLEVRASLALSYRGLDAMSARLLRLWGLLKTVDIAAWVAAPLLDASFPEAEEALERLVDAQLVDVAGRDGTGELRYRLHDLVRLYAWERAHVEESEVERYDALQRAMSAWLYLVHRTVETADLDTQVRGMTTPWKVDPELVDRIIVPDPLAWFDAEQLAIAAAIRQAGEAHLDELCWELTHSSESLFSVRSRHAEYNACLEIALPATRRAGNKRGQAYILLELGSKARLLQPKSPPDAIYREALRLFNEMGDRLGEGRTLTLLAMSEVYQSCYDAALIHLEQALAVSREAGHRLAESDTLRCIGMTYLLRSDITAAAQYLEEAASIADPVGHRTITLVGKYWLGRLRVEQGRLEQAEDAFEEALGRVRATGDLFGETLVLYGFGLLRLRQSRLGAAEKNFSESLTIARDNDYQSSEAQALGGLGMTHYAGGRSKAAIAFADRAIDLCREHSLSKFLADSLTVRGDVAFSIGACSDAVRVWTEAIAIYTAIGSRLARKLADRLASLTT